MTANKVLLVTASYDRAAGLVEERLSRMGEPFFRLDTDRFPFEIKATYSPETGFTYQDGEQLVKSDDVAAVWYRRNVAPSLPDTIDQYDREFCTREQKAFIEGTLATLNDVRWLSHPSATAYAEHKLGQLTLARKIGFSTPATSTTNDPVSVKRLSGNGSLIAKSVKSGYVNSPDGFQAIFTTRLSQNDLQDLDGLDLAPATFQELIPKKSDIRVTIVGANLFAAEILSQEKESSSIDWRATDDPDLKHEPHVLPNEIAAKCHEMVHALGLSFGAIDLVRTPEDNYVFLEINPNGEWLWLEYQLEFPIAQSIADWLTQGTR